MVLPPSDGLAYLDDPAVANIVPQPCMHDHSLYSAEIWETPEKSDAPELGDTQLIDLSSVNSTSSSESPDSDFPTE